MESSQKFSRYISLIDTISEMIENRNLRFNIPVNNTSMGASTIKAGSKLFNGQAQLQN